MSPSTFRSQGSGNGSGNEEQWVGQKPRGWETPFNNRTALVLSGGGLKFAVHAGIYREMDVLRYTDSTMFPRSIKNSDSTALPFLSEAFDCIVGTSAGSLVGAALACGFSAEDAARFSLLFSQPSFQPLILDVNWLGAGSFLLKGDLGYIKGLYRGEAIRSTLEVFFSHNFLRGLGQLYSSFAKAGKNVDGTEFDTAVGDLVKKLYHLPREKLPEMTAGPNIREATKIAQGHKVDSSVLRFITFQDINPGVRVPYLRFLETPDGAQQAREFAQKTIDSWKPHASAYSDALAEYFQGRAEAKRTVPRNREAPRPMLLITGTDLVTGQKTIFGNYNLFEKELVYRKDNVDRQRSPISYRYINSQGLLSALPASLSEELRPANYLYKYLSNGLPVSWAVRASLSIPGVFSPSVIRYIDNYGVERTDFFIDGGVTDNYALQVGADWRIGRCGRILGGEIGNLGPRVHDYQVRNIIDIVLRTLLTQGDVNVDSNAENSLVKSAVVTTIDELTTIDVSSIRELNKIPQLLLEGRELAEQFFAAYQGEEKGPLQLERLFNQNDPFTVFLPRIETLGRSPNSSVMPLPLVPKDCFQLPTGASEIDRIAGGMKLSKTEENEVKKARSQRLGLCEAAIIPPPVLFPVGFFGLTGGVYKRRGQNLNTPPSADLINLVRLAGLIVLLVFITVPGIGFWRGSLYLMELTGWTAAKEPERLFDNWSYWLLLSAFVVGAVWNYLVFFRALIFDFWVAHSAKSLRRILEIPLGLLLYFSPLYLFNLLGFNGLLQTIAGLILFPFSAGALLFILYAFLALVRSFVKGI